MTFTDPAAAVTIEIRLRHAIWQVTSGGKFYGDYRTKTLALEGAETAASVVRKSGRKAQIVTAPTTA